MKFKITCLSINLMFLLRNVQELTRTTDLSFCPSSVLFQQLRSQLCACWNALNTNKNPAPVALVISCVLLNISACSFIKEYFPDKEKDYQLTTEIPALSIPDDLTSNATQVPLEIKSNSSVSQQKVTIVSENTTHSSSTETEDAIYVDLVEFSGGATRIRIEDTIERSWRTVGKALSRQSIEITDRNEDDRVYFVQYDPDFKKIEDGSIWDEVMFIFGTDPAQEKEFRVSLVENGTLTEIIVLDNDDKPLSSGTGLKLLNLLYKTIKEDLAD